MNRWVSLGSRVRHPPPWSLSFRSQSRPAGAAPATLERVVCLGLLVASSEAPGPSQPQLLPGSSLHQLLFTIYLFGCYEMGFIPLIWEFWPWSSPWEGLGHSDHPGIHQARADPAPHPALFEPTAREGSLLWASPTALPSRCPGSSGSAWLHHWFHFSTGAVGSQPWSRDVGQGTLWTSEQRGTVEIPEKKIICLFCHVFADLDSLVSPFLVFLLSRYYSTFQL